MCTAILNRHSLLPKEIFDNVFINNPDGIGIGFVQDNKLRIYKDLHSTDRLYKIYSKFRKHSNTPVFIHARIGTAGSVDKSNIHPYRVNSSLMFMHNGIVDIDCTNAKKSDTWHVARAISRFKKPDNVLVKTSHEYNIVNAICGTSSKFIFMNTDNKFVIMNEKAGHYDELDNWYSNHNYLESKYYDVGGKKVLKSDKSASNSYNYDRYDCWEDYNYGEYSYNKSSLQSTRDNLFSEVYRIIKSDSWIVYHDSIEDAKAMLKKELGSDNFYDMAITLLDSSSGAISAQEEKWLCSAIVNYEEAYYDKYKVYPDSISDKQDSFWSEQ